MLFGERLRQVLRIDPAAFALEFERESYSWGELGAVAGEIGILLAERGVEAGAVVGWIASNTPTAIAALTALAITDRCAGAINPHAAPRVLADDIRQQRFPAIVGDASFWSTPGVIEAAGEAGSLGIEVAWSKGERRVRPVDGIGSVGPGPHRPPMPDAVLERLSSGTTGPPKRTPYLQSALVTALRNAEHKGAGEPGEVTALKRSPAILLRPLAHGGGGFAALLALYQGRPVLLFRKFDVAEWVDAIRRHRPKAATLVPAMIAMILDAGVAPEDLASLKAIRSGTAPLDPGVQAAFEERFGVPILIDYGATEFGGAAGWSLDDHRAFAAAKRGSVGRAQPGVTLRIVDPATRAELAPGDEGLLEVRSERIGPGWISTNDIAVLDEDGFLFIRGRADDAIVRGGFKVLPDDVARALREHADIRDAAVIGVPDKVLGQVPVAFVERYPDRAPPDEPTLKAFARARLTPYQVPVAIRYLDDLPRTTSAKVIRAELRKLAESDAGLAGREQR